jgi:hypothetical protein
MGPVLSALMGSWSGVPAAVDVRYRVARAGWTAACGLLDQIGAGRDGFLLDTLVERVRIKLSFISWL